MSNSTDYINTRLKFFINQRDARHTQIDKRTGERPYVHNEETRRKAQLQIDNLSQAMVYQQQQDAKLAQAAVVQREADAQAVRNQHAEGIAIRARAADIRREREAVKIADSAAVLSGPGSEVSIHGR